METRTVVIIVGWVCGIGLFLMLIGGLFWAWPKYSAYKTAEMSRAMLEAAKLNKEVAMENARGKAEAEKILAQAEVDRAKSIADATRIMGEALRGNDGYLRYLWVQAMQAGTNQVIYVPTEAQVPIVDVRVPAPAPY